MAIKKFEFYCSPRLLITWLLLAALASLIYCLVVFGSLVDKAIVPNNNVPKTIPYITIPSKYDIFLKFDSTPLSIVKTFTGSLLMYFVAKDITQRLFLHRGKNIDINMITLEDENGSISIPALGAYDSETEVQAYLPVSNLTKNKNFILRFEFTGLIDDTPGGPNTLSYEGDNGTTQYAITFGHPITTSKSLRYLIPCLDSQDFPAYFNINIQHSPQYRVLSNFPGNIQQTFKSTSTIFNGTFEMIPSQIALAMIDVNMNSETSQNDLTINKFFRKKVINTISTDRVKQFMAQKSLEIGKLDALSMPGLLTMQQPGISFLNEHDVLQENIDFGLISAN